MYETAVACFIGLWLAAAGVLSYKQLKKDYEHVEDKRK